MIFLCRRGTPVSEYRKRIHGFFATRGQAGSASEPTARKAAQSLHAYEKDGAAEHLFCVAAGLDSLNPGDAQILGQVKDALHMAQRLGLAGAAPPAGLRRGLPGGQARAQQDRARGPAGVHGFAGLRSHRRADQGACHGGAHRSRRDDTPVWRASARPAGVQPSLRQPHGEQGRQSGGCMRRPRPGTGCFSGGAWAGGRDCDGHLSARALAGTLPSLRPCRARRRW